MKVFVAIIPGMPFLIYLKVASVLNSFSVIMVAFLYVCKENYSLIFSLLNLFNINMSCIMGYQNVRDNIIKASGKTEACLLYFNHCMQSFYSYCKSVIITTLYMTL